MDTQALTYLAGIVIGSSAVLCACYVWMKKQVFGMGGSVLSLMGMALMGLSIWSGIHIKVSETGIEADFKRLAEKVEHVALASENLTAEVKTIAETTQTNKTQFVKLATALESRHTLPAREIEEIRKPVAAAPALDVRRISEAQESLRRARELRIERVAPAER